MAGRIGTVLSLAKLLRGGANVPTAKVDVGGEETKSCDYYANAGDDAPPLPGDYVAGIFTLRTGLLSIVGALDPANEGKAAPGEKRIYARDPSGAVMCEAWLKGDGTVVIENAEASITLQPDGTSTIANTAGTVDIAATGLITLQTGDATFTVNPDDTITGVNAGGSFILEPGGNFVANGATMVVGSGDVTTQAGASVDDHEARITALETAYNAHTHTTTSVGQQTGTTSDPV